MNSSLKILILLLVILSSCQKLDWNNPFDSKCPKEIWTPTDFKAVQEGTSVKLTWSQPLKNISGFKLTKKVDTGTAADLQNQTNDVTIYIDANLTGGALHTYTLVAYAGNNLSNILTAAITPKGPASGVTTTAVSNMTATTVSSGGTITNDGGSPITARGVCWGTTANPTIAGSKTTDGTGIGTFTSAVPGLTPNTTYFLRAYAINSISTVYGNEISFKTPLAPILFNPTKTYGSLTDVEGNSYKTIQIGTQLWMAENLKTTKYKDGTAIPLITDNTAWANLTTPGYCWYNNDQISNKDVYGALYNWYTVNTNNLCPTGWHVPTDAEWTTLTTYLGGVSVAGGKLKEIGTSHWQSPNLGANNESGFTALPGGTLPRVNTFFDLGDSGLWWSSTENTLTWNAWYRHMGYYNSSVYIGNSDKQNGYSVRCIFGELPLPTLSTSTASSVIATSAVSGGNITNDGGTPIIARGVCWSTSANPTIANTKTTDGIGAGSFTSLITGLSAATTYYIRAYATNSSGTAYGQQEICVSSYGTVADVDGNTYQTVKIGNQIWTRENLKTTKYKDGSTIPLVTDNTAWANLTSPGYCWYNNDAVANKNENGTLYNWYTVYTNKLCPTGWHVPTDLEWSALTSYVGGDIVGGGKLKETGTGHWLSPNTSASNETGFTALPGGYRNYDAYFIANYCYLWSSTENSSIDGWGRYMGFNYSDISRSKEKKQDGFSVRCISGELALPTLSTSTASSVTTTSTVSGGNITNDGGTPIIARGVCWSTTTAPTILNSKTTDGSGTGSFTSTLTGLAAGTTYYLRAYATNSVGTAYGNEINFKANAALPTNGLIAYYPFNGNANDASGNNLNGTVNEAILSVDRFGNINKAYYFNGTTALITVPHNVILNAFPLTINVWFRTNQTGGGGGSIINKYLNSSLNGYNLAVLGFNGHFKTQYYNGSNNVTGETSAAFNDNQWHMATAVFNSTNLTMYIDNILVLTLNWSGTPQVTTSLRDLLIGKTDDPSNPFYQGFIDDIRIFNLSLTPSEISALFYE